MIVILNTVAAVEIVEGEFTTTATYASSGLYEEQADEVLHTMQGQALNGYLEITSHNAGMGLLYLAIVESTTVAPPAPILQFTFSLLDQGIEWVRVNWT